MTDEHTGGPAVPATVADADEAAFLETDGAAIPDSMSEVVGRWLSVIYDSIPDSLWTSDGWSGLLPLVTASGRDHEAERLALLTDWLWNTVLPSVQPAADASIYGAAWRTMCSTRTAASVEDAVSAIAPARSMEIAAAKALRDTAATDDIPLAAAEADSAATEALYVVVWGAGHSPAGAAEAVARAAHHAAQAAGAATWDAAWNGVADVVTDDVRAEASLAAWRTFEPMWLLRRMIKFSSTETGAR